MGDIPHTHSLTHSPTVSCSNPFGKVFTVERMPHPRVRVVADVAVTDTTAWPEMKKFFVGAKTNARPVCEG